MSIPNLCLPRVPTGGTENNHSYHLWSSGGLPHLSYVKIACVQVLSNCSLLLQKSYRILK